MTTPNDFLFYDNSANGVTVRSFTDFTSFAFETAVIGGIGAIVEDEALRLAERLFTNNSRIVVTNLTFVQTQMPLKIRGTVAEITQYFNVNYVFAPVIHPLVVGIANIAVIDAAKGILDVRGVIINTNAIQYTHERETLAPSLVIETEEHSQEVLSQLMDVMDKDPDNIALLIPMRDAIHEYEEKAHPIEVPVETETPELDNPFDDTAPIVNEAPKPKRKPRKKKE